MNPGDPANLAYLNGEFLPLDQAHVSVMDRGFLFGDGVYEVIPVYSRRPFRLAEHLLRLARSLAAVRISNPHADADWAALIDRIIAAGESEDQSIYLQVTRGVATVRNHALRSDTPPTVFIMGEALRVPQDLQRDGITAVSAADNRWQRCDIKTTSLLPNCLLRQRAVDAGAAETVLFRDGFLAEGAASSIFVVSGGMLLAPQKNHHLLPGITYDIVLELAVTHGLPHQVRDIPEAEVRGADELWLASSPREVLPIIRLDDRPVGAGVPGPVYARMIDWYRDFKARTMRGA
ncbi:MAG: D-amino acid aminotransferase [Proteobacteria bacterium]|nr:D-amino acid aminotransferase [Pseudomonadota bacterium]HQR03945.1 D-amino acid aminotransferase [Rhodocyclaceae bacterium]